MSIVTRDLAKMLPGVDSHTVQVRKHTVQVREGDRRSGAAWRLSAIASGMRRAPPAGPTKSYLAAVPPRFHPRPRSP